MRKLNGYFLKNFSTFDIKRYKSRIFSYFDGRNTSENNTLFRYLPKTETRFKDLIRKHVYKAKFKILKYHKSEIDNDIFSNQIARIEKIIINTTIRTWDNKKKNYFLPSINYFDAGCFDLQWTKGNFSILLNIPETNEEKITYSLMGIEEESNQILRSDGIVDDDFIIDSVITWLMKYFKKK